MPVLKGSISFSRFRAESKGERPRDTKRWLSRALRARAFEPLDKKSDEDVSAGWVEIEDADAVELSPSSILFGEYLLVSYRIDRLRVPGPALRAELDGWSKKFEDDNGRPPRRSERAEQRELIVGQLKKRVFPSSKTYDVSWNLSSDQLQIWTTSKNVVEEIQEELEKILELRLQPLSPGAYASRLGLSAEAESLLAPTAELIGMQEAQ